MGKKVSVGLNKIKWNGVSDLNTPLPSRIYFYQLKIDNFNKTGKMLLIR